MGSTFIKTDTALENKVARVLLHQKKLLRLKNWLRSPLLRLPQEIIIHILSYVMDFVEHSFVWEPILSTCHHIYTILCAATELWWKVNIRRPREARIVFMRSNRSPQVIIAELAFCGHDAEAVLDHLKERVLDGYRLCRLEFVVYPSDVSNFYWIFERPLPRLNHLKIHFDYYLSPPAPEDLQLPVTMRLPTDMSLRVLDLRNITLPWSSNIFTGLSDLRIDFTGCDVTVGISEDELLGILGASPQLECLKLMKVGPRTAVGNGVRQFTHGRIVQLSKLGFLKLENSPEVIGYILAHICIPTIASLHIRSLVRSQNLTRSLDLLVPYERLPKRLFSNPPIFEIEVDDWMWGHLMKVNIGGFNIWFDFDFDDLDTTHNTIVTRLQPLVPPYVTFLTINSSGFGLNEAEWRGFLGSHPGLYSIDYLGSSQGSASAALWDALSPSGVDTVILCPRLESILLHGYPSVRLSNCLLNRKNAGFKLEYLELKKVAHTEGLAEDFGPLVEALEIEDPNEGLAEEVSPVSMEKRNAQ